MNGSQNNISIFMSASSRFHIPCYQRPYSWTEDQCRILFKDMLHLHEQHMRDGNTKATHFIGSIVCQKVEGKQTEVLVIDGQQRLTTMYLFYLALNRVALERDKLSVAPRQDVKDGKRPSYLTIAQDINIKILSDQPSFTEDSVGEHRFELTIHDQEAMDLLFAGNETEYDKDSLLTKNYQLFKKWINESDLSLIELYNVARSLVLIEIELDPSDDAQLIFESLNSKGLDLSEGDKVRNYILMGFSQDEVKELYYNKWRQIEIACEDQLTDFIRYYLAIQNGRAPSKEALYIGFKDYVLRKQFQASGPVPSLNQVKIDVMDDLITYSKMYGRIRTGSYELAATSDIELGVKEREDLQEAIARSLQRFTFLDYSVRNPVIMQCLMLHRDGLISGTELLDALELVETFFFRRWACGVPSQGLNRTFQSLAASLSAEAAKAGLVSKLVATLCVEDKQAVCYMPNDEDFVKALQTRDLYSNTNGRDSIFYMLERLENYGSLEQVSITKKKFSIEHIMPQKLSSEWLEYLGPDAYEIKRRWLHCLANLTLTAYNSNYRNSSFADKCSMKHGFKESPMRLNRDIAAFGHWGPDEMQQRADKLIAKALVIWPYPGKDRATRDEVSGEEANSSASVSTTEVAPAKLQPVSPNGDKALPPHSAGAKKDDALDFCLADGERDLVGTKPTGFEFMGQHYDANSWIQVQRMVVQQVYQSDPERFHVWFSQPNGDDDLTRFKNAFSSTAEDQRFKTMPNLMVKLENDLYFYAYPAVNYKIKQFKQLFAVMGIEPQQLTIHLRYTDKNSAAEPQKAEAMPEVDD